MSAPLPGDDAGAPPPPASRLARWRDRDHTRGSLLGSMWVLSLPLMLQSVAGAIAYQLVDLAYLAQLGERATTAVIVTNQSLRQVAFMLAMGASFGAQGWIARAIGGGDREGAEHVAGQVVLLGAVLAVLFAVGGGVFAGDLLALMSVSPEVMQLAVPYAQLVFVLSFGFVGSVVFNAILSGAGDATTPLFVSIAQTAVSLVAEWALIFGHLGLPALGVQGVALGAGIGQATGLGLALAVLFRGRSRVHLRRHHLVPDAAVIRHIAALGWPPALQMSGNFLVTLLFIRLMGQLGAEAQAAYSIGLRISMMGPMLAFPLAGAAATLVGQSLGAGGVHRARRALAVGIASNAALLWPIGAGLALFRREIMGFLASDPLVIAIGAEFMLYQAGAFGAWAFFFVFFRALQGAGDVVVPMLISLGSGLLCALPLGLWLVHGAGWGPTGVFAATLFGAWFSMLATGGWVATGRWTRLASPRPPP